MSSHRKFICRAAGILFFALIFITFFNGIQNKAPSRSKFKKLGESTEVVDLTKEDTTPEVDRLKEVVNDGRLKKWAEWWRGCATGFDLNNLEDIGISSIYDEKIDPLTDEMKEGPNKMFYIKSPDGKKTLNPYFKRLIFKKEGDAWQSYINPPCGVALYDQAGKKARNVMDCTIYEGIEDAFWKGNDKIVLMGYSSVSRQMNVECETVESCMSPTIWIIDLKTGLVNEQHGGILKRGKCDIKGYLKKRLPNFFGEDAKEKK